MLVNGFRLPTSTTYVADRSGAKASSNAQDASRVLPASASVTRPAPRGWLMCRTASNTAGVSAAVTIGPIQEVVATMP